LIAPAIAIRSGSPSPSKASRRRCANARPSLAELARHAEARGVGTVMRPYLEALTANA
jgi:hypothetical protein